MRVENICWEMNGKKCESYLDKCGLVLAKVGNEYYDAEDFG
jgi:hypothetical protein